MTHTLADLLAALPREQIIAQPENAASAPITGPVDENSAAIQPGGLFVARIGRSADGHTYISDAVQRGAAAVVGEKAPDAVGPLTVPYIQVRDAFRATGRLAAAYHGYPSRALSVVGVTGTNGKTTTTHLLHSILREATGGKAGFISTIAADFGGRSEDTGLHVTTPHAPDVQRYLAQMVEAGLTHVVLEMTSHGLAQGRLSGVDVDVAVLTNITHEHLDYHGSFENYRAAKGILFQMLSQSQRRDDQPKVAVINADDPSFDYFAAIPAERVLSYAMQTAADLRAENIVYAPDRTRFNVGGAVVETPLVGAFNVANILAAIGAAQALGVTDETAIQRGVAAVTSISGRMERIDEGQNFVAIVDFAHTPDALEKALAAGRTMLTAQPNANRRLIAVFGSAGLRDVEKRRLMAEVSARHADITVLTAEDPRTESLDVILEMMAEGCRIQGGVEGETFYRVPDRGAAIAHACQLARPGDMVMVCGKGHEQSMCFGEIEYPWDDRAATRAALRGTPLKTLPTAGA